VESRLDARPARGTKAAYRFRLELVVDVEPPQLEERALRLDPSELGRPPEPDDGLPVAERGQTRPEVVVEAARLTRVLEGTLRAEADGRGGVGFSLAELRLEQRLGAEELAPLGLPALGRVRLALPSGGSEPAGLAGPDDLDASDWGAIEDLVEALRTSLALVFPSPPPGGRAVPGQSWDARRRLLPALQGLAGLTVEAQGRVRLVDAPDCLRLEESLTVEHQGMLEGTQDFVQVVASGPIEATRCLDPGDGWPIRSEARVTLELRQRRPRGADAPALVSACRQSLRFELQRHPAQRPASGATRK
jgi:hypothetical protein